MPVPKEARQIVMEEIAALSVDARVAARAGLDKRRWRTLLIERMEGAHGLAHGAVAAGAADEWYGTAIEYFIRHTRVAVVDNLLGLADSLKAARDANEVVQVRTSDGSFLAKRYLDLTPLEADVLAEQYERQSKSLGRKAAQIRADARQARLSGLAEDQPFSSLLAA